MKGREERRKERRKEGRKEGGNIGLVVNVECSEWFDDPMNQ